MNTSLTLSQVMWPQTSGQSVAQRYGRDFALAVAFSVLIGAFAHIGFPLPGTPVPVTLETFGVLLTGSVLGVRLGVCTTLLYLTEAVCGLPVLAPSAAPHAGLAIVALPTFGYLMGFVVAAGVAGWLAQKGWDRNPLTMAALMIVSSLVILALGALWLAPSVGGLAGAFEKGIEPFLVGDLLKSVIAAGVVPVGWRLLGGRRK